MVQTQVIQHVVPNVCYRKPKKPMKNVKTNYTQIQKNCMKKKAPVSHPQNTTCEPVSCTKEKKTEKEQKESDEVKEENDVEDKKEDHEKVKKENHEEIRKFTTAVEDIKKRRREERLAKQKQADEERERFVKNAEEKKAAERAEIIKEAKRIIFYRKPMCRRINQGLVVSECLRELEEQLKFRETIKNIDKEAERAYVKSLRDDLAKYEEETKKKADAYLEKRRNYATELRMQIEEIQRSTKAEENRKFQAEKQELLDTNKYLADAKEREMQELLNKKQRLSQFFKDAIEEKKQFDLKLKYEEAFEDRAIEIYQKAKARIRKAHKEMILKEKKERERRGDETGEKFRLLVLSREDNLEKNFKRAVEEQEAEFQEKERIRKERDLRMKKEVQDFKTETAIAKSKLLQEENDLKTWEVMQRFKKAQCDKETEVEERKRNWNKKMEYAKSLKKYISEKDAEKEQEKLAENKVNDMSEKIIDKENKRVLDYADEVLNESKGVRPLFPILKAVEDCKKEMGLLPAKKREETLVDTKPKKRRVPRVCTKLVPEDKICYL
ncbi:uncharacterized protein LOC117604389 isoform X1 [Osmia lignaria lignaria]|uniref:uncharacterized protein LOC117604389 isoform X1 n=1 Tax=Osmia lignaria lignaria TaxID=1437193 RepID=UPI00402B771B